MTDKEEQTPDNNIEEFKPSTDEQTDKGYDDDLDIVGALAAVASLQDLGREAEAEIEADEREEDLLDDDDDESPEIQEFERIEEDESDLAVSDNSEPLLDSEMSYDTVFPRPPASVLHRGQLASVIPAVLLIGIGAYLTFILTTSAMTPEPGLVVAIFVGGLGAMLLAQWISSARWSIGSFFIGVVSLLTGATATYLVLPNNLSLTDGYPLLLTAIGTAFVITDVFVPSGQRIWLIGLILAIAGLVGVATTTTIMNLAIADSLGGLMPLAIVIIIVLLIAPILRRRQQ